jgi:hypothetical protein
MSEHGEQEELMGQGPMQAHKEALDAPRSLGIGLRSVVDVFPAEAKSMRIPLVRHLLAKQARSPDEDVLLGEDQKAGGAGDLHSFLLLIWPKSSRTAKLPTARD